MCSLGTYQLKLWQNFSFSFHFSEVMEVTDANLQQLQVYLQQTLSPDPTARRGGKWMAEMFHEQPSFLQVRMVNLTRHLQNPLQLIMVPPELTVLSVFRWNINVNIFQWTHRPCRELFNQAGFPLALENRKHERSFFWSGNFESGWENKRYILHGKYKNSSPCKYVS